ncbi:MAG TPA: asparaginase [Longimicrobiaceae bacterium]|nr:asparaginase [Longimicrobiaceae bacterium]
MREIECTVDVVRGSVTESRHRVHVAVVDAEGQLRACAGDPDQVTFIRSAAKPLQALAVEDGGALERFGISDRELALVCGSHAGSPAHTGAAESVLRKIGLDAEALACGPHAPFHEPTRRELQEAGLEPVRLHNNCSGKHAGMLALARARGWETQDYQRPEHPVQLRMLSEVSRWAGVPAEGIAVGNDGCGVVCFALPLRNMALAYARLAGAARRGERGPARVVGAMTAYPEMVAGKGRLCTELMRRTEGRVFAKVGAEGVYCVGVPGAELGVAVKVEDGSTRAVGPAILGVLRELDLISEDDYGAMYALAYPDVVNTRGEVTGQLRPNVRLRTPEA